MQGKWLAVTILCLAGMAGAGVASAHHSYAVFDMTRSTTINGVVKRFEFNFPHTWLYVDVKDEKTGAEAEWRLEGADPRNLAKRGWTRKSLQPGDKVSVLLHPLRDGTPGGSFTEVTRDGVVLDGHQ